MAKGSKTATTKKDEREEARRKLKERMDKSKKKGSGDYLNTSIFKSDLGERIKFWRVTEDDHWIDIIPYKAGRYDPDIGEGNETYVFQPYMHKNVGPEDRDVICLTKTYGKACPICERVKKLISNGEDPDDIDFKVQSNPRAIYNVVCYDDDKETAKGVQIFHTSHFTMEQTLLELATSKKRRGRSDGLKEIVYYADPEIGKTVTFKRKGKGVGTRYLAHNFEDRDYEITQDILDEANSLDELVVIPTYEQSLAWLDGEEFDSPDEPENEPENEPEDNDSNDEPENEPESEEEQEEDDLRKELGAMAKSELRKFIKEEGLEFKIERGMNEEAIVKGILSEMGDEEEEEKPEVNKRKDKSKDKGGKCPGGGVIGKDLDTLSYCDECDPEVWEECVSINDGL